LRLTERQIERLCEVASNLVVTVLVVATIFEDLGISLPELILLAPSVLQQLLREYFFVFIMCHWLLLVFLLVESYVGAYVRSHYPDLYQTRYLPAAATATFVLAFLSFIAFRRFFDLFLMVCSVTVMFTRGGSHGG